MATIEYLNFDLRIKPAATAPGRYLAQVVQSPGGEESVEFDLPFAPLEYENFMLRVGRAQRATRNFTSAEVATAKIFGGKLFASIFQGQVENCLIRSLAVAQQSGLGLRLRLRLNEAQLLADWPWEFLFDANADRFLAHSISTPIVRYVDLPLPSRPLVVDLPLQVLVMISNPTNVAALDVEQEWQRIQEALADLYALGLVEVTRLDEATLPALQRQLRRKEYHVFHFVGHADFDERTQGGVLVLEDDHGLSRLVEGDQLGLLLHDHPSLRLAILNACEGARNSAQDPFAGVAQSLIQQGIPAVIAMQFEISDRAAITFAQAFYQALVDRYPVDAALGEARKTIYGMGNELEWATPVLFMRIPDGQLFLVNSSVAEKSTRVEPSLAPVQQIAALSASPAVALAAEPSKNIWFALIARLFHALVIGIWLISFVTLLSMFFTTYTNEELLGSLLLLSVTSALLVRLNWSRRDKLFDFVQSLRNRKSTN